MEQCIHFERYPARQVVIGSGSALLFSGFSENATTRLKSLEIAIRDSWQPIQYYNERREDLPDLTSSFRNARYVGFWGTYNVRSIKEACEIAFRYRARFTNGKTETGIVCRSMLTPQFLAPPSNRTFNPTLRTPRIAICLATYEPDFELFKIQIDSLISQTHKNWYCIVSDDASNAASLAMIVKTCQSDNRFQVFSHDDNLGFYLNFERALTYTPIDADYVALCDQDDFWYPCKLRRLIDASGSDVSLTYSDMKLVDESGATISDSYWTTRRNNYNSLHTLMAANTITGAASLFPRKLLDVVLPFPPRIADAYHDHWIALTAFLTGRIQYIPEALYDYRQHARNIIGHTSFIRKEEGRVRRSKTNKRTTARFWEYIEHANRQLEDAKYALRSPDHGDFSRIRINQAKYYSQTYLLHLIWFRRVIARSVILCVNLLFYPIRVVLTRIFFVPRILNHYRIFFLQFFMHQYRSLELFATVLSIRLPLIEKQPGHTTLKAYHNKSRTISRLLWGWLRQKITGNTTGNRDLYMALGCLAYKLNNAGHLFCKRPEWVTQLLKQAAKTHSKNDLRK